MSELNFTVNFDAVSDAAARLGKLGRAMADRLVELDKDLAPLRVEWTGAASEAYAESKKRWDAGIEEMRELLLRIGASVGDSGTGYSAAERANAQRWG